jgi:uncharacterized protein (DUF362 family)
MMVPSTLCVLDASRILLRNGPTGGNLKDVEWKNVLIAGTDPVEVDALGTTLFGMKPSDIGYLRILGERKHGEIDLAKVKVTRGTV